MAIFITGISALDFYRKVYPVNRAPGLSAFQPDGTTEFAYKDEDIWSLAPPWVTPSFTAPENGRIHLLTNAVSKRASSRLIASHLRSRPLPDGSCFEWNADVLIASPAFTFLTLASDLNLPELIAVGDELCGLYGFDESDERGFKQRTVPLITINELSQFIEAQAGLPGQRKAKSALRFVIENSASPMETLDEMFLCLPCHLGGYGLTAPAMNYPIPITGQAARFVKENPCRGDMCWPDAKLDVEHLGGFDHSSPKALSADRARVNAIKEMGYEVIELTGGQVANLMAFETIALRIAKKLGERIRKQTLGATENRVNLRNMLFAWNGASGRKPGHSRHS